MKAFIFITLFLAAITVNAAAQRPITGLVVDDVDGEPMAGVSVTIRDSVGKIKRFITTKADGVFTLKAPVSTAGLRLEASLVGYARQSFSLDSISFPQTIRMTAEVYTLNEVSIRDKRLRAQGDTLSYNVGAFAQPQDKSIGDVLRHMPGIDVKPSGEVQYQGEAINKFYIEGTDMLGGKYGVATNGINHNDVGAVQVMENHQPLQVLSGTVFSDRAAINLKMKGHTKATWNVHGHSGGGWSWQPEGAVWDGEFFALAIMPSMQSIITARANNIGEDLSPITTDFLGNSRGTSLNRYINIGLPSVPSLDSRRTLFNRSFIVSANNVFKICSGELKVNLDYSFNRLTADATTVSTYYGGADDGGNRIISEHRSGTEHAHSLSGNFSYETNQKTLYLNNDLKTNIDWDDMRLATAGNFDNMQTASLPDYYIANNLKAIKRFAGKHLVTFASQIELESLPQTLTVIPNGSNAMRQHVSDRAFYTHESAAYAFVFKGINVGVTAGVKANIRDFDADLSSLPSGVPGLTYEALNTSNVAVYAKPRFEYMVRAVDFTVELPLTFAHYGFDKALEATSQVYFSPNVKVVWTPQNRLKLTLNGSAGRTPMNISKIHNSMIMSSYKTFACGADDFYDNTFQRVSASAAFKNTGRGLFANATFGHSWNHSPYTIDQIFYGDYLVYGYKSAATSSRTMYTMANIGQSLDFMHGTIKAKGLFSRANARQYYQSQLISTISTTYSVGGSISTRPLGCLSADYSIDYDANRLSMDDNDASWLGSLVNRMNISVFPMNKLRWDISGEHYHNEISDGLYKNVLMLDTKVTYTLNKRIELSASLSNILDKRTYNYTTYSQTAAFESQRNLRGRELLLTITLTK